MNAHSTPSTAVTLARALAVACAVVAGAFGVSAAWAWRHCPQRPDCPANGVCAVRLLPWPGCLATDQSCAGSEGCRDRGACSVSPEGTCEPLTDTDCAAPCEREGRCRLNLQDGIKTCIVGSDEDCSRSRWCKERGRCSLRGQQCDVGSDADCKVQEGCRLAGACTYGDEQCRAAQDTDCAASEACRALGWCKAEVPAGSRCGEDGMTRPVSQGPCATQSDCRLWAACAGEPAACKAAEDSHCRQSLWCSYYGRCVLGPGELAGTVDCRVGAAHDCKKSEVCKRRGWCSWSGAGNCIAAVDTDCAQSEACTRDGRCAARGDDCLKSCSESAACLEKGLCTDRGGRCVASAREMCVAAAACRDEGQCAAVNGKCRVASDGDCMRSTACKQQGRCDARGGGCKASIAAQCQMSEGCKREGKCSLRDGSCLARSREDCARSDGCKEWGRCAPRDGTCRAEEDADCGKAVTCTKHGRCQAQGGVCVASR